MLVDHDLSPSQARNLERATSAEVLDRSAVILAIFQRHARSREARLQVEIARLSYWAPRVREQSGGKDREGGGIGGRGAGESQLELDRRKLRDRIAELRAEIKAIEHEAGVRRQRREEQNKVALVGYTNAGKSSLMRALTGSGVAVADRLFATLDTTVRALQPETKPRVLVSDTVGFIKKLPHELVASFRSTLDEARDAELLLHVVDAADAAFPAQIEVTRAVLDEIGAQGSAPAAAQQDRPRRRRAPRSRCATSTPTRCCSPRRIRRTWRTCTGASGTSSSATWSRPSSRSRMRSRSSSRRSMPAAACSPRPTTSTAHACGCARGPKCSRACGPPSDGLPRTGLPARAARAGGSRASIPLPRSGWRSSRARPGSRRRA